MIQECVVLNFEFKKTISIYCSVNELMLLCKRCGISDCVFVFWYVCVLNSL